MKKRMGLTMIFILTWTLLATTAFANDAKVTVFVNGKTIQEDAFLRQGKVFVPIRVISRELGFKVDYDPVSEKISLNDSSNEIILFLGKNIAYVNKEKKEIDVAPFMKNNKSYIPLRFISDVLGEKIVWDDANSAVIVGSLGEYKENYDTYTYHNKYDGYTMEIPKNWGERVFVQLDKGRCSCI